MITVLYFAAARERTGVPHEHLEGSVPNVRALLELLARRHPALEPLLPHLRVAVNHEFGGPDALIPEGAEVALIPPVSGGSGHFRVFDRPLELQEVLDAVSAPTRGGVVTFSGAVRDNTKGKTVTHLDYEAYVPMAERVLAEIGAEAEARWPGTRVAVSHRVGRLLPGELAVVIAAAAPHRAEAFRACEHVIERLKQDAPIWKKEYTADGAVWVGLGP